MFRRNFLALIPAFALAPLAARAASHVAPVPVEIKKFKFVPATVEVTAGHEVVWTNLDGAPHTATAMDKSFGTERLRKGDSEALVFMEPGTYEYQCRFHPNMKGTVVVT